jgi:hypothetical protein
VSKKLSPAFLGDIMVILIISIIVLFIGLFLFYRAKGIKNIRLN